MIWDIFTWLILAFISLIPIIFWWYLFSYFDDKEFNKKRFFIWILAWSLSVIPVLFLDDFISKTNFLFLDIFSFVYKLNSIDSLWNLFISFGFILFFLSVIPFLFFFLFPNFIEKIKIYFKEFLIFFLYLWIVWILLYLINNLFWKFNNLDFSFDAWLNFWEVLFNSLKLVIFYYLIIAILEELSKFFCFNFSKNFSISSVKDWVLYAIFIALWFAFIENILYFSSLYEKFALWKELIWSFFSRNIFSVFLHVICSSVFAYYFSQVYLKYKYKINFEFIKILFIWFIFAILLHWIFNIFLTFDLAIFVFLYLIWWYFYLTYIFYSE